MCGEAHGGKLMGMSKTYGKDLRFVVFDVNIGGMWLAVPNAAAFAAGLGLQFVHYNEIPTTIEAIDAERDADSVQAVRNGMGTGHIREGVVLRPPIEVRKNNDERITCKHKRKEFMETKTERTVDPEQLRVLADADAVADEWVTPMRLSHVLQKMPVSDDNPLSVLRTKELKEMMLEDVLREGAGEIVVSKEVCRAIATRAVKLFHARVKEISRDPQAK